MYVITNREIVDGRKGLSQFGKKLNEKGANELRAVRVSRQGRSTKVEVLRDKLHYSVSVPRVTKLPISSNRGARKMMSYVCHSPGLRDALTKGGCCT